MAEAPKDGHLETFQHGFPRECIALLMPDEYFALVEPPIDAALVCLTIVFEEGRVWKRGVVTAVPSGRTSRNVNKDVSFDVGKTRCTFMLEEGEGTPSSEKFTWALVKKKAAGDQLCFFADSTCLTPFVDASNHRCECGHAMHNLCNMDFQQTRGEVEEGKFYCRDCLP